MESIKSRLVEILRFGGEQGILRKGDRYLVVQAHEPLKQIEMPLDHDQFLDYLSTLRYSRDSGPHVDRALSEMSRAVKEVLALPFGLKGPVQIDLVASAAEIWALPFEALLDAEGEPVFASSRHQIILTRRIRQEFVSVQPVWPSRPRILFAHASPAWVHAPPVPADRHLSALREALKPWIEPLNFEEEGFNDIIPDQSKVLTVLENAGLADIQQALRNARKEGKPYSYVHLLAHGLELVREERVHRQNFGIALASSEKQPTPARELVRALSEGESPMCITLAVCDGGNQSNTIVPESIAQSLHAGGVPIVIASQLPLTFEGSVILARTFYTALLNGEDVRSAIHRTRVDIRSSEGTLHDWMGLLAYVRLPEGYNTHLMTVTMQRQLAALKTAQFWSDQIVQKNITSRHALDRVEGVLEERIQRLEELLEGLGDRPLPKNVFEENAGLLGSAWKRLAELKQYRASIETADEEALKAAIAEALDQARRNYRTGHDYNLGSHWNGVQHLSLEAVLTGRIEDPNYWQETKLAAERDIKRRSDFWASGTLAELYLLSSLVGEDQSEEAVKVLRDLDWENKENKENFYGSTLRQFRRYVHWWTKDNGFFPGRETDLAAEAKKVVQVLEQG